jgi:hypothetical protein
LLFFALLLIAHILIFWKIVNTLAPSSDKNKTFKPKKKVPKDRKKQIELHKHAKKTLGSGNLRAAVVLPASEELDEWLAANSMFLRVK